MKLWSIHNVPVQKFTCSNCFYISGEASTCDTSVTDRSLCPLDVNCEFHSIWVEMAVGLTSQLFLRLPASHIFCQRNKFRVHIAHWFFGTQSFFCYCFMNLSFSLSLLFCAEPSDEEFSSLVIHFVSFNCWCMLSFFSIVKLTAQFIHSKINLEGGSD